MPGTGAGVTRTASSVVSHGTARHGTGVGGSAGAGIASDPAGARARAGAPGPSADGPGAPADRVAQTRSAAIRRYWKEPSLYELMKASSMPVTRDDVARNSQ